MADVIKVKASDGTIYDINDANDYTKDETDALLADKADVGVSYTKAEDDALLATKADTTSVDSALAIKANVVDVYSKTEADNLLAGKADIGVSYTKAEDDALLAGKAAVGDSYTKAEEDALLADKANVSALADYVTVGAADATYATKSTVAAITATMVNIQNDLGSTPLDTTAQNVHDAINELLAEIGGIVGMPLLDWSNPLAEIDGTSAHNSYTCTEDCWLCGTVAANSSGTFKVYVNGQCLTLSQGGTPTTIQYVSPIRLTVGDVVTADAGVAPGYLYVYKERS